MTDIDTYVAECARFRADVEKLVADLGSLSPEAVPAKAENDDGTMADADRLGSALPPLPGDIGPTGERLAYTAAGETIEWIDFNEDGKFSPSVILRSRQQISEAYHEAWEKVWWDRRQDWLEALRADVRELPEENRPIVEPARAKCREIEAKYGIAALRNADPMENQGILRALGWVLGDYWEEAADT